MADDAGTEDPPPLARIDFSDADEARMGRLAWAMRTVGLLQVLFCGLGLLLSLALVVQLLGRHAPGGVFLVVGGLLLTVGLPIYQGMLLREAGEFIGRAARDDDDDQDNIMAAFRRLKIVFMIEAVLGVLVVVRMT